MYFNFFRFTRTIHNLLIYIDDQDNTSSTKMATWNCFTNETSRILPSDDIDLVFENIFQMFSNYDYKIVVKEQPPRLIKKNGKFIGQDVYFMELVAEKQNSTLTYIELFDAAKTVNAMSSGTVDLILETSIFGNFKKEFNLFQMVNTFDVDGYCALIPIPSRNSFWKYLITPFDWIFWILLFFFVTSCALLWWMFKRCSANESLSSPAMVLFGILANFLGQSITLHYTRWFHSMVIQLFVLAMLIFGNCYQSLLVSMLTISRNGTRITTIREMIESDYNFEWDSLAEVMLNDGGEDIFDLTKRFVLIEFYKFDFSKKFQNNTVIITRCDVINSAMYSDNHKFNSGNPSDFYYVLPEKLFVTFESLMTSLHGPFAKHLQDMSLQVFETGIKQYWATLLQKSSNVKNIVSEQIEKEEHLLKMGDLKFIFFILGFGLFVASAAFLLESFIKITKKI